MKKILRPFTGTGSIFFPIGPPPTGTCEYATKQCMVQCYAMGLKDKNYDIELLISEEEKQWIYNQFITRNVSWLTHKIVEELDGLQTPILHWFGSGDVLDKDIDRISLLVSYFNNHGIEQIGFTRNIEFWKQHKGIFALTVESLEEAKRIDINGFYSIPDYRKQETVMCSPSAKVRGGYCGPMSCDDLEDEELNHYINCRACRRLNTGCFDPAHRRLNTANPE